jgi:hypothetical protein
MINIDEEYRKIKKWLYEYNKFVVNEREDDHYHFSFWIWDKKEFKSKIIPVMLGYLKEKQLDHDCIQIGYGMNLEMTNPIVKAVMTDPFKNKLFINKMKDILDPTIYLLKFSPTEENMTAVKISTLYPIEWLDKKILYSKIIGIWITYANLIHQLEVISGRSDLSDPSKYV